MASKWDYSKHSAESNAAHDIKIKNKELINQLWETLQPRKRSATEFITFKSGKIKKTVIEKTLKSKGYTKAADKLEFERTINRLFKETGKWVSTERAWASFTYNKIEGMLSNTGFTLEQLANQTNSSVEELTNEANWTFSSEASIYTNELGEQYEFVFTYTDAVFTRVF